MPSNSKSWAKEASDAKTSIKENNVLVIIIVRVYTMIVPAVYVNILGQVLCSWLCYFDSKPEAL